MSTVKNPAGYYEDIEADFDEIVLKSAMLEDIFYLKDLKQRKLFIMVAMSILGLNLLMRLC